MLLKYLFAQYDTRTGPTFASRFMTVCGNLILGTPEKKGFGHLRKDLQGSYYRIKEDRQLPNDKASLQQWQIESIFLEQYRGLEAPQVAKATFFGLLPIVLVCVLAASVFNGSMKASVKSATAGPTSWIAGLFKSDGAEESITFAECKTMVQELMTGETTQDKIPNYKAKEAECIRLGGLPENMNK